MGSCTMGDKLSDKWAEPTRPLNNGCVQKRCKREVGHSPTVEPACYPVLDRPLNSHLKGRRRWENCEEREGRARML